MGRLSYVGITSLGSVSDLAIGGSTLPDDVVIGLTLRDERRFGNGVVDLNYGRLDYGCRT